MRDIIMEMGFEPGEVFSGDVSAFFLFEIR